MLVQHPVMSLGRIINMLQRGLASFKRLSEILEQPGIPEKEMEDAKEPVGGDLEVKDLSFRYEGADTNALDHISVTVPEGATLGIVGPTGSGKTTLVQLLLKMYEVPSESIYLGGKDITGIPANMLQPASGKLLSPAWK